MGLIELFLKVHFGIASPLQTETANASMDSPTAIKKAAIVGL